MNCMSDQPVKPEVKRRRRRTWLILCLVGVLLICGLYIFQTIRQAQAAARLQALIAAIEKEDRHWKWRDLKEEFDNFPISLAFLKCITSVPPNYLGWIGDDNATRDVAVDYQPQCRDFNVRYPDEYYQILKKRITDEKVQPLRKALLGLAQEPGGFRLSEKSSRERIDVTTQLRSLIIDEMYFAAHQGDGDQLIMTLRMAMKNARLLEQSPGPLEQTVAIDHRVLALAYFNRSLALCQMTDQQLQQLQSVLDEQIIPTVDRRLKYLRAMLFSLWELTRNDNDSERRKTFFNNIVRQPDDKATWNERAKYWVARISFEFTNLAAGEAELLEVFGQALSINAKQPDQVLNHLQQEVVNKSNSLLVMNTLRPCVGDLSEYFQFRADFDSLRVAIACERYRLAQGNWPPTLSTLVPQYLSAIPLDPFSGQPLLYRLLPDGVVIYSVGTNGVDDQGDVLELNGSPKDRGTRLFNPEHRGKKYEPPR